MPYFRIDDGWWSHPKTMALSPESQALWCRAGAWSMQHFTDGLVPKSAYAILGAKPRLIAELVAVGYWAKVLPGHQFHDWEQYQETAESLKKRRDRNKERMRSVRAHNADTLQTRAPDVRDVIPSHPIPPNNSQSIRPVLETDAKPVDNSDEVSAEIMSRAASLGVDLLRVRRELSRLNSRLVAAEAVLEGIALIIGRAKPRKGDRTGLVLASLRSNWAEWERIVEKSAA